jgi:hypothetical protein
MRNARRPYDPHVLAQFRPGTHGAARVGLHWWRLCSEDSNYDARSVAALLNARHGHTYRFFAAAYEGDTPC